MYGNLANGGHVPVHHLCLSVCCVCLRLWRWWVEMLLRVRRTPTRCIDTFLGADVHALDLPRPNVFAACVWSIL